MSITIREIKEVTIAPGVETTIFAEFGGKDKSHSILRMSSDQGRALLNLLATAYGGLDTLNTGPRDSSIDNNNA